ncbi:MAG: hypothetical protein Q8N51_14985 [Gammaproteobacteria bacterium]|nr:hypothetical protein [Gammaproteobacteria bacterium]
MTLTSRARAHFVLLGLALACGARAQEPVRPEPPRVETRAATAAVDPRPAPPRLARAGSMTLDSSAIRGNQELPKVMYIVPWKDPAMAELAGRPVNSLVEEILAPVDREVFRRQTRYFSQLYGVGTSQSAAAVPGGPRDAAGNGQQIGRQSGQ